MGEIFDALRRAEAYDDALAHAAATAQAAMDVHDAEGSMSRMVETAIDAARAEVAREHAAVREAVARRRMEEMAAEFNLPAKVFPEVTFASMLIGPAAVFLFSLLAAVYPAFRLHWLQPVEAMRAV